MILSDLNFGKPSQVAVIVGDMEKYKKNYAALFGKAVPSTQFIGDPVITKTEYMGKPAPESLCDLAFFDFDGIQIELIQPYGGDSTWMDWLKKTGGGLHHFGFQVKNMEEAMKKCEEAGFQLTQKGTYGDGSGMYAYYDATEELNCFIELLISF